MSDIERRAFLRRIGSAGLALPLLACEAPSDRGDPVQQPALARPLTRPVLRAWGPDAVRLDTPLIELPMAYISMARREVFVDNSFRDRSNWMLDAHISVSTGVWRIPLPGDPIGQTVTPGDTLREFEELYIVDWDPAMEPAEGDFRIRRGRPARVEVNVECVPIGGAGAWLNGAPRELLQCDGSGEEACREDFVEVGSAIRHSARGCSAEGETVRLMAWICRE